VTCDAAPVNILDMTTAHRSDLLTLVSAAAKAAFEGLPSSDDAADRRHGSMPSYGDQVIDWIMTRRSIKPPETSIREISETLSQLPDFKSVSPSSDSSDPMLFWPGGGSRRDLRTLVASIFAQSYRWLQLTQQEETTERYVEIVLDHFEQFRRAASGQLVEIKTTIGLSSAQLPDGRQIETPWGTIKSAPAIPFDHSLIHATSSITLLLANIRSGPITISNEPEPASSVGMPSDQWVSDSEAMRRRLPLAFALATMESQPCAPTFTFHSLTLPFVSGFGHYREGWPLPPRGNRLLDGAQIAAVENWSQLLYDLPQGTTNIAEKRIISALAHRSDPSDALIDAVTVWESLVGGKTETVFRVTAALVKLIEPNKSKRLALRKELGKIYDLRSRIVHGDSTKPVEVAMAAQRAVNIGLTALATLFGKPIEWLAMTSSQRADQLIFCE
jgi:Apea-like HEPN